MEEEVVSAGPWEDFKQAGADTPPWADFKPSAPDRSTYGTEEDRRAAKGRALRGEATAERRSGYGASAILAGAEALEFAGQAISKADPLTIIPRLAWNVNEMGKPPEQQQAFPLDGHSPIVPIPRFTTEQAHNWLRTSGVSDERMAGIANAGIDFAEFFTTPTGINTLLSGKLGPEVAKRALAMGFTAQMAEGAPEAMTQAGTLVGEGDVSEGTRATLGAAAQILLPAMIVGGHAKFPRVPTPAEQIGRAFDETVNAPSTVKHFADAAEQFAAEWSSPARAQLALDRRLAARPPEGMQVAEGRPWEDFKPRAEASKVESPPEPLSETAPSVNSPALRGEAAMETRPSARWTPDGPREPAVSPDLAETIQALREGYVPAVERAVESPAKAASPATPERMTMDELSSVKDEEVMRRNAHFAAETQRLKTEIGTALKHLKRTKEGSAGRAYVQEAVAALKRQDDALQAERNDGSWRSSNPYFAEYERRISKPSTSAPLSPAEVSEFNALEQQRRSGTLDATAAARYRELEVRAGQGDFLAPQPKPSSPVRSLSDQRAAIGQKLGEVKREIERLTKARDAKLRKMGAMVPPAIRSEISEKTGAEIQKQIVERDRLDEEWHRLAHEESGSALSRQEQVELNDLLAIRDGRGGKLGRLNSERIAELEAKAAAAKPAEVRAAEPGEQPQPPAQAAPAMQEGMDNLRFTSEAVKTAKGGGADAKDARGKLVAELEKAADQAKPMTREQEVAMGTGPHVPRSTDAMYSGERGRKTHAEHVEQNRRAWEEAVEKSGLRKVTVEIPGDGTFTVWNTKENLGELLRKAKKLETATKPPKGYSESGVSKEDREWTAQMQAAQGKPMVDWDVNVNIPGTKNLVRTVKARTAFEAEQEAAAMPDVTAVQKGTARQSQPATPDINTGALGESGMGGAKPGEFRGGQQTPTGIKNATVDRERAQRGLPPAMEAARRDWGSVWDEAMARVDNDPATVDRLIAELKEKPRALTDTEDALLLHRQIDLQNEYGRATRELAVAYEDSKAFPNRLADVEALKVRTAELSDQLLDLYNVNKSAGTETGRGLAARKMMANEDFSLAAMEMQKRAALGGAPLTEAERAAMVKLHERIVDLERRAVEREEQVATERAGRMTDEAIADMKRELKSKPSYSPQIIQIAEEVLGKLKKQADKSRDHFKGRVLSLSPEDLYHLGVIGAEKIARTGLDITKFGLEMAQEFGAGITPHIKAVWDRANLHLENEGAKYGDKSEPVKRLLRKRDAEGQREGVIEGLKKGVEEGLPVGLLGDYVRKLALSFVRGGVTERNALVDAVHKVLTEDIGMELSRRETMDAVSGYGRFKPLDADAAKAQLRDLKGQMQQVAKLEDITAKKPLQKTGVERRTQSDEERRLIQQVNEAKRRFGVIVTDPARQLKSALDAVRTRLKHQVADLEYQIATKERIVKSKTDAPFDAETKLLETRRDALRAQLDELVPKPGRTDAQLLELAVRNTERSIADYEARIAGGEMLVKRAKPGITSPELAALKARRDAVRAEWQELRELDGEFQRQKAEQALTRQKSALEESIAAKEKQLAEGPKPPAGREVARPADPALEELMQKRDGLNRQLAEARKKPWEVKHAEQVARKLAAMEKSIAEREAKLAAGDLSTESRARVARPLADPELELARQKLDDVNRQLAEARKPKGTPEERALKALHTRLATSAAEYADRLARGDFSTRARKPIPTDPTTLRLKAEAERAKAAWHEGLERDRFHRLSRTKRAIEHAKEVLNVPRAVLASWDVSAVLRQGGFITLGHPLRAASSLGPMFSALKSETDAHVANQRILARDNAPLYARAKLFLAPLDTSRLTAMEEIFMSRLSRVLPGVRPSERAYITFLNKLRADSFDAMVDRIQRDGPSLNDAELQAIGNFVNVSTGRGNMGSHAAAAETMATVFFSPRLVVSRFQLITGQPLRKAGSARVARAVAAEYAGFLGGLAVVYALANLAGASVEVDPRSSDFGKLRFGNTRVDPLAGLAQATVLLSRLGTGEKKTISGKVIPIRGDVPYGADTSADVIARFLRSKLSPVVGAGVDIASGQNVIGETTPPASTLQRLAVPLSFEDIYKVMLEDGIPKGTALGILSLFGWGLQQHDEPKPSKSKH